MPNLLQLNWLSSLSPESNTCYPHHSIQLIHSSTFKYQLALRLVRIVSDRAQLKVRMSELRDMLISRCYNRNIVNAAKINYKIFLQPSFQVSYVHSLMFYQDLSATINPLQIKDLRRSKQYSKHLYNYNTKSPYKQAYYLSKQISTKPHCLLYKLL